MISQWQGRGQSLTSLPGSLHIAASWLYLRVTKDTRAQEMLRRTPVGWSSERVSASFTQGAGEAPVKGVYVLALILIFTQ